MSFFKNSDPSAPRVLSYKDRASQILEYLIFLYLIICLVWFGLFRIVPFINFSMKTPLRKMIGWLRTAGIFLSAMEFLFLYRVTNKREAPGSILMYGVCIVAAVSSFIQRQYGYKSNLDTILWMFITLTLFYSAPFHSRNKSTRKFILMGFGAVLLIWTATCSLSIVQFALQIGAFGPNKASTPWLGGVGFNIRRQRLYGLFAYPEYGAVTGLMLILISLYYCLSLKKVFSRLFLFLINIPIFLYIVVSISRNAAIAMYETAFLGTFLFVWKYWKRTAGKNMLTLLGIALGGLLIIHCVYIGTREAAKYIPAFFHREASVSGGTVSADSAPIESSGVESRAENSDPEGSDFNRPAPGKNVSANTSRRKMIMTKSIRMNLSNIPVSGTKNTSTTRSASPVLPAKLSSAKDDKKKPDSDINLEREYKEGDISTGRLKIWKDYLSLYREIGLVGLSPENAGFYIQEHNPNLFICTYVRETDEALYKTGYVFHTHNGYLKTFVSTGFLGLGFVLIFMILTVRRIWLYLRRTKQITLSFLFSLLVCLVGASSAIFDNEIFFNTNPTSLIFWISLCILMKSTSRRKMT